LVIKGTRFLKSSEKSTLGLKGGLKLRLAPNLIKPEFHPVFFVSLIGFNESLLSAINILKPNQCFFFGGRIFATWRPKRKGLANPIKGFLRFNTNNSPYLEQKRT
jgi:hypothetical protein